MKNITWLNHLLNFLAVILGVFLAFSINSLAERQKQHKELGEITRSLIEDLEVDRQSYEERVIPSNIEQSENLEQVIKDIVDPESAVQTTANLGIDNYSPSGSTYLSITSSGKINLIGDLEIRKELSYYYDMLAEESKMKGQLQADFFLNELMSWMIDNTTLLDVQTEDLQGNMAIANMMALYKALIDSKVEHYQRLDSTAIQLKQLLSEIQ